MERVVRESVWFVGWLMAGAVTALYLLDRWERSQEAARQRQQEAEHDSQVVRLEPRRTA